MPIRNFATYEEFFTFYLQEHSDPVNRWLHAIGTVLGLATLVIPFIVGHPFYALAWPLVAYGFAWTGHFLIEGNKPASFIKVCVISSLGSPRNSISIHLKTC